MFVAPDGRHVRDFDRANCDCGDTLKRRRGRRKWFWVHDNIPNCPRILNNPGRGWIPPKKGT